VPAKYDGEDSKLDYWFELIIKRNVPTSVMYPSRGRCEIANLYYRIAPNYIKKTGN
jgi:hypothetical protein